MWAPAVNNEFSSLLNVLALNSRLALFSSNKRTRRHTEYVP